MTPRHDIVPGLTLVAVLLTAPPLTGQTQWTTARPDGHAPIGVTDDQTFRRGELLLSYRLDYVSKDGNLLDSEPVTAEQILEVYDVTPVSRPMFRHEPGFAVGITDRLTVSAALPFVSMRMDHVTAAGGEFETESSGVGDLRLEGLLNVYDGDRTRAHIMLGLSLPTGTVSATGSFPPRSPDVGILPYPLQRGAGTPSVSPGVSFFGQGREFSWGLQFRGRVYINENSRNYRMGDEARGTFWVARRWTGWLSTSARLGALAWEDVWGFDPDLVSLRATVPTADQRLQAGNRVDLLFGVNLRVPGGRLEGQRLAVELGVPVHQSLDGPQLETDWLLTAGVQYGLRLFGGEG